MRQISIKIHDFLTSEGYNALNMPNIRSQNLILFYDDQCGLCQRSVRFFIFLDHKKKMHFAPLFGESYQQLIPESYRHLESVVFYKNGRTYIKSNAILFGISSLGGFYQVAALALIIPKFLRDFIYDEVAKRRKKITCDFKFNNQYVSKQFLK